MNFPGSLAIPKAQFIEFLEPSPLTVTCLTAQAGHALPESLNREFGFLRFSPDTAMASVLFIDWLWEWRRNPGSGRA
jgi:hypothetical protein